MPKEKFSEEEIISIKNRMAEFRLTGIPHPAEIVMREFLRKNISFGELRKCFNSFLTDNYKEIFTPGIYSLEIPEANVKVSMTISEYLKLMRGD